MSSSRRSHRGAICVVMVFAVALAGCNAFSVADDGGSAHTPADSVTPVPVPTDSPTPTPSPADVPGLSPAGVVDGDALIDAHQRALRGRSFSVRIVLKDELINGSVVTRTRTVGRVDRNQQVYIRSRHLDVGSDAASAEPLQSEIWDGSGLSFRASTNANHTTEYRKLPEFLRIKPGLTRDAVGVLAALDPGTSRVLGRTRIDGTTLYRIRGRTPWLNGTHSTHMILVGADGRVRTVRTVQPAVRTANVSTTISELRYTDIDNTTVERPAWYHAAIENTTGGTAVRADDH